MEGTAAASGKPRALRANSRRCMKRPLLKDYRVLVLANELLCIGASGKRHVVLYVAGMKYSKAEHNDSGCGDADSLRRKEADALCVGKADCSCGDNCCEDAGERCGGEDAARIQTRHHRHKE